MLNKQSPISRIRRAVAVAILSLAAVSATAGDELTVPHPKSIAPASQASRVATVTARLKKLFVRAFDDPVIPHPKTGG